MNLQNTFYLIECLKITWHEIQLVVGRRGHAGANVADVPEKSEEGRLVQADGVRNVIGLAERCHLKKIFLNCSSSVYHESTKCNFRLIT